MLKIHEILNTIMQSQSIEYAVFNDMGLLESFSEALAGLISHEIKAGMRMEEVFPELTGLSPALAHENVREENLHIDHIARPDWRHGQGYMSLYLIPIKDRKLVILKDSTDTGILEQRLMQQRNDLALLTNQLEQSQARLTAITSRFMPGAVMETLLAEKHVPALKGSSRVVTIVFADLRGFTRWSQQREPEALFAALNSVLSRAADIVFSYNGTLDKYMGDAVMVIFNAPRDQPDHVLRAVKCAQEISRLGLPDDGPRFGVGVHTGKVIAGNVGAEWAMNYTVLGNPVNLAKHLEEIARPGEVLLTAEVADQVKDDCIIEPCQTLNLKKHAGELPIYRLVSTTPTLPIP
jgi:class 3 adenylate cyclase